MQNAQKLLTSDSGSLVTVLRLLLKPIARFCLRHAIPVQDLIESSKVVMIEAAAEELEKQRNEVTISRLRVMTGLHRRDVTRIYRDKNTVDGFGNYIIGAIGQWQHNSRFMTKSRKPRILTFETEDSEFNQLVKLISTDVHPGSVLFELERIGAVVRTTRGLKLVARMYDPKRDPVEGFRLFARDSEYLLQAVEENVLDDPETPNLHILTEYDNLSQEDLDKIREWMYRQGSAFHKRAREFLAKFDLDINPNRNKTGGGRAVLGTFAKTAPRDKF